MKNIMLIATGALLSLALRADPTQLVLVENGVSKAPIIVAEGAPEATMQAVKELSVYIQKISGVRPPIIVGEAEITPINAIWVGPHPKLAELAPDIKIEFQHPEEILFACNGKHLVIAGRDRIVAETQTEHGTANAVYTFLEKRLDVRWLWPGKLGEDIIEKKTIVFEPFEYRFHPVFRQRHFWPRQPRDWHRHQRLYYYSYTFNGGHGFVDWWETYHAEHPDYFALQPNGKRIPPRNPHEVKLCLSNPGVWAQCLDNAEEKLRNDPSILTVSGSPNDGLGHCVCENCRAWDPKGEPKSGASGVAEEAELGNSSSLTDRHVKFWNILARGLKERFPDREVYIAAMAYGACFAPPVAEELEKNVAIAQVGYFPLTSDAERARQKAQWKQWADKTTLMSYRPNLWYWCGGVWGMPEVAMTKTIEDFRFLADNKCIGIIVDVMRNHWGTQGPQYYLMAQLAYDPYQDGTAVMKDYYRRAFGPAAAELEQYWTLMEKARDAVVADPKFAMGSSNRGNVPPLLHRIYSGARLQEADTILRQAEAKVVNGPEIYERRVAYVRAGLDFTRLLIENIPLMTAIRESGGTDSDAINRVVRNWEEIETIAKEAEYYAISFGALCSTIRGKGYMGNMQDYLGPPSEEFLKTAREGPVEYLPAKWTLAWSDNFDRDELAGNWNILHGDWNVEDGHLVTSGGSLVSTRTFPGLQRVEFRASITPNPGMSDMSPVIQCGPTGHSSGYLMQFGGYYNKRNCIQRKGAPLILDKEFKIQPGKIYSIAAEYDGSHVRLIVDGKTLMEKREQRPLVGPENEQIGFYVYEGRVKIDTVSVYTSQAVRRGE